MRVFGPAARTAYAGLQAGGFPKSGETVLISTAAGSVGALAGQIARINRNVLDGPLYSGSQDFGWGFGVQALSQLEFDLPACASAFRAHVGIDRSAGDGGCVRARVYLTATDKPPAAWIAALAVILVAFVAGLLWYALLRRGEADE